MLSLRRFPPNHMNGYGHRRGTIRSLVLGSLHLYSLLDDPHLVF
jgi:hypothetical protein